METLFANRYTRTGEWAKDIYGFIYFRRPVMIALHLMIMLYLAAGVAKLVFWNDFDVFFFGFPVFFELWTVLFYRRNSSAVLKRDLEIHGKPIEVVVEVTEEGIRQTQSTGSEFKLKYCDIKRAVQTKRYIYLRSKTNMIYSFGKDSFTVGTAEDFLQFLKSQGLKVK